MKRQGKQTKRGTSQKPLAQPDEAAASASTAPEQTKPGVAKPMQHDDFGQGAMDFHQSNHGKRGR
jgi:hypothetical protein